MFHLWQFGSMQQSPCLRALPDLKPRENGANPMDGAKSGDLKNWTQFGDRAQSGEGACCNCRVLNLVSTCFVFFSSLSHCCCHDVPCGNDCAHSFFRLRKLECFRHVLWRIQVSRWYVLRTTQNGDFVLLPLCVAPCWRTGALSAQLRRQGAVAPERVVPSFGFPLVYMRASVEHSILTHATALEPSQSNEPNLCLY